MKQDHANREAAPDAKVPRSESHAPNDGQVGWVRRAGRSIRDGWFGPPRPSRGIGIAAVALAILGVVLLGERGPANSITYFGLATLFGAEFAGNQRVVVCLRFVGALVALAAAVVV